MKFDSESTDAGRDTLSYCPTGRMLSMRGNDLHGLRRCLAFAPVGITFVILCTVALCDVGSGKRWYDIVNCDTVLVEDGPC